MSGIAAGNIGEVVTIALKAEAKGDVVARSVELIGPSSRARFSFGFDRPLEEAFCPDAAVVIRSLVERIIEHEGILTLPDVTLRLPTLVLSDCFVIATDVSDGGAQIIVRFKQFEGDLFSLFDEEYTPRRRLADPVAESALRLLEGAYIPLADIAAHIRTTRDKAENTQTRVALDDIAERIDALEIGRSLAKGALRTLRDAGGGRGD